MNARTEIDLLICCARTTAGAAHIEKCKALTRRNIDWECVIALADMHGLLPLLRIHLEHDPAVPLSVRDQLRRAAHLNARRNLQQTARWSEALTLLKRQNIAAIPFKGPALAARAYGDISRRQFGDLDFFVNRAELYAAYRALAEFGFVGRFPAARQLQELYFQSENQVALHKGGDVCVELHWAVRLGKLPIRIEFDDLWRRAGRNRLAGTEFADLSTEDLLLLLLIHGASHEWRRIGWICDIAEVVRSNPKVAWPDLQSRASAAGVARAVRLGLHLASDVLGTRLPDDVERWMRADASVDTLATKISRRFFVDTGEPPRVLGRIYFYVAVRERRTDRINDLWRYLLRPNAADCTVVHLPPRLAFLYFFIRPVRLIAKHGYSMFRRLSRHITATMSSLRISAIRRSA